MSSVATQLADDFKKGFSGNLPEEQLNGVVASLRQVTDAQPEAASTYPATASISALRVQCTITGGKTFNSSGHGGIPGPGDLTGYVSLAGAASLDDLYRRTTAYFFTLTPVYAAIYFIDANGNLLAFFQAGAIAIAPGTGGGSGKWS